jgi:hypothetical protein
MRMKALVVCALALFAGGRSQGALLNAVIQLTTVDYTTSPPQITIQGLHFGTTMPIVVLDTTPLNVVTFTDTLIVALVPNNIASGDYALYVNPPAFGLGVGANSPPFIVSLGVLGPVGPQGSTGATGAQGPKGDTGATGAQGPQGNTGATGAQGQQGAQGNAGATGAQGSKGDTGSNGAQGPQGNTGSTGAQGLKGDTGSNGAQGLKGDTGSTGAQGTQGNTGSNGAQGLKGDTGSTGAQGLKGDTGATGSQGAQGNAGAAGAQGLKGDTGAMGAQGPAGSSHAYDNFQSSVAITTSPTTVASVTLPSGNYALMAKVEVANGPVNNTSFSCQLLAGLVVIDIIGSNGSQGGGPASLVGVSPQPVTSASITCSAALGTATAFSGHIMAILVGAVN